MLANELVRTVPSPTEGQTSGTVVGGDEDDPVSGSAPARWFPDQRFRREERRYLLSPDRVTSVDGIARIGAVEISAVLDGRAERRDYRVRTVYLGGAQVSPTRWRLRYYDDGEMAWLERKRRKGLLVAKRRAIFPAERSLPPGLRPIAGVVYERSAWEFSGIRVTLDRGVTEGWGDQPHTLTYAVLEVKGKRVPRWLRSLLPRRARQFSKRRWAIKSVGTTVA